MLTLWTDFLANCITTLAGFGLSEAAAIIVLTLIVRSLLLPLTLKVAYRAHLNKLKLAALQPKLEAIRQRCRDDGLNMAQETSALYRKHGIRFFDKLGLFNLFAQGTVGIGIWQTLKKNLFHSNFLWIADISKGDVALTFLVGVLIFISSLLLPNAAEQSSLLLLLIPAVIAMFVLMTLPSAVALYWGTSSAVSIVQALCLRWFIYRDATSPTSGRQH